MDKSKKKKKKQNQQEQGTLNIDRDLVLNLKPKKVESFLEKLKEKPELISPVFHGWFCKYLFKEKKLQVVEGTLQLCLMVICGTQNVEQALKSLTEEGLIKTNVCGTLWKEGGFFY